MKSLWLIILLLFSVSGCSDKLYPVYSVKPMTTQVPRTADLDSAIVSNVDGVEIGDDVVEIAGYVKDASISKESIVHTTLLTYFKEYVKAYKESGFKMDMKLQTATVNGVKIAMLLPSKIEYRNEPRFQDLQQPPTEPSKHPVWPFLTNVVDKATIVGLGAIAADFLKSVTSTPSTVTYNGPYAPNAQESTITSPWQFGDTSTEAIPDNFVELLQ